VKVRLPVAAELSWQKVHAFRTLKGVRASADSIAVALGLDEAVVKVA
jgi:hypothetical protein